MCRDQLGGAIDQIRVPCGLCMAVVDMTDKIWNPTHSLMTTMVTVMVRMRPPNTILPPPNTILLPHNDILLSPIAILLRPITILLPPIMTTIADHLVAVPLFPLSPCIYTPPAVLHFPQSAPIFSPSAVLPNQSGGMLLTPHKTRFWRTKSGKEINWRGTEVFIHSHRGQVTQIHQSKH